MFGLDILDSLGLPGIKDFMGMEFNSDEATAARDHSAQQAEANRQFQERMSGTAHQREVADLQAAGLNPMLSAMRSGASTPGGMGTGSPAASYSLSGQGSTPTTAAQVNALNAQAEHSVASADRENAQADSIRETTPVNIQHMQQQMRQSVEEIEKIRQDVRTGTASAANIEQQTRNLQEQIPQIRASTKQLKTLASLNEAQAVQALTASGLNEAHAKEIYQRVKQNLPELERAVMDLERIAMLRAQPGQAANEAANDSFMGQLGAYLKAAIPLNGIMGMVPMGRTTSTGGGHLQRRNFPGGNKVGQPFNPGKGIGGNQ